jgi:hypothetical protein
MIKTPLSRVFTMVKYGSMCNVVKGGVSNHYWETLYRFIHMNNYNFSSWDTNIGDPVFDRILKSTQLIGNCRLNTRDCHLRQMALIPRTRQPSLLAVMHISHNAGSVVGIDMKNKVFPSANINRLTQLETYMNPAEWTPREYDSNFIIRELSKIIYKK